MAAYYQLGPNLTTTQYSGSVSAAATYGGSMTTVARTTVSGDTVELVLFEVPAGTKISSIGWAIGGSLGTGTSGTLVIRKKDSNPLSGSVTGTVSSTFNRTVPGVSITTTAAGQGTVVINPKTFEGLTGDVTKEAYQVSLLVSTTGTSFAAQDVYVEANGQFIGFF